MKNEIDLIEKLNLEIIELKASKEYKIGKMIKNGINLKKIKKFINNRKIAKYNSHSARENGYEFENIEYNNHMPKIVVYTCITGGYDQIKEPLIKMPNVDFVAYTDNEKLKNEKWNIRLLPNTLDSYNNILKNRYLKMHPFEFFKEYDYALYIDGNVQVVSDVNNLIQAIDKKVGISMHRHQFRECIYKELIACKIKNKGKYEKLKSQIEKYQNDGFPKDFGMLEATIILTDLNNNKAKETMNMWWKEFLQSDSLRDQISLPYIIWKSNLSIDYFDKLGKNLYKNPKFRIEVHD